MVVTDYQVLGKLPDLFCFEDGTPVRTAADWRRRRRELFRTAVDLQYGVMPPEPEVLDVTPIYLANKPHALNSYRVTTGPKAHPISFIMYLHLPAQRVGEALPIIVDGDLSWHKCFNRDIIREIANHDFYYVTFNRVELAGDVTPLGRTGPLYEAYPEGNFGALCAWAWGYSRCVDAMEQLGLADMAHIAFTGLSRGGKAALLAGAVDERASIVNPVATCAAGGGCYRVHMKALEDDGQEKRSETLDDIYHAFPFWFTPELGEYCCREEELPFDSHFLKAMVAPRILFDGQAISDIWANPIGSYQSSIAAREAWKLVGNPEDVLMFWHEGGHAQPIGQFRMLLNIMEHSINGTPLDANFWNVPFEIPAPIHDWRCPEPV